MCNIVFTCNIKRMDEKIKTFSKFGATKNGGITRLPFTEPELQARAEFARRMRALGAKVTTDDMANMYATINGSEPGLKRIAMSSHIDSMPNGGNYDGILGIIAGMEVIETIVTENIPHRHPITVIIWTNEEGILYPPAMMGSGVITGKYEKAKMLASRSAEGKTFGEALDKSGYKGDEKNRMNQNDYQAMFELHIEQGPVLYEANIDIGVVLGVLDVINYRIKTYGHADHSGAISMKFRRDALYAAAQLLIHLHNELDNLKDDRLIYTTAEIECRPNKHSIVHDYVGFALDVRHEDPEIIKQVIKIIENIPKEVFGCKTDYELSWAAKGYILIRN
jgi:N-carbamoyl-L-amino-acid hydrolase